MVDGAQVWSEDDREQLARLDPARTLLAVNKSDLPRRLADAVLAGWRSVSISAREGRGLAELRGALAGMLGLDAAAPMGAEVSARHRQELVTAATATDAARDLLDEGPEGLVLAAQRLREAALALGRITGRVWSEDLLDAIFSRFCVGK